METPSAGPGPNAQRRYTAPCPGCGAPVEFRSAQSTHAVCAYCQSMVVRQGEVLQRLGKMAELFDDHSPLQLGASGRFQTRSFTLIGRLQYKAGEGVWAEWIAQFDNGELGWLAEDNGAYVFSLPLPVSAETPALEGLRVGMALTHQGVNYTVTSRQLAVLISAQGELPKLPPLGQAFDVAELRNERAEVLSIDYGSQPPALTRGKSVLLEGLQLSGLKGESIKDSRGRQFNCPHCGAAVTVALETSKSVSCSSCNSLIDISQGIGGELKSAIQDEPVRPLIPLGKTGRLQGVDWQVVGFQHRMGQVQGDDEQFGWSEYLLYNQKRGFAFLVDSEEGWSMVRPVTGAPKMASSTASFASYLGSSYQLKYNYTAETVYVCGEFYWQVKRGQKTRNRDFALGKELLSIEQSDSELVWSKGGQIASELVAGAFGLAGKKELFQRTDVTPFSAKSGLGLFATVVIVILLMVLFTVFSRCSSCNPQVENCASSSSARSSGGSYGGFSGGGGHK